MLVDLNFEQGCMLACPCFCIVCHMLCIGSSEYSRHGSLASRDLHVSGITRLGPSKTEEGDIDEAFTKYSSSGAHSNGDEDEVPSSPDSDSGGRCP